MLFRYQLAAQLVFTVVYYLIATLKFLGDNQEEVDASQYYYPEYGIWLCVIGSLLILGLFEELTKTKVRTLFERDHSRLKIFFSTKLGMWSPR